MKTNPFRTINENTEVSDTTNPLDAISNKKSVAIPMTREVEDKPDTVTTTQLSHIGQMKERISKELQSGIDAVRRHLDNNDFKLAKHSLETLEALEEELRQLEIDAAGISDKKSTSVTEGTDAVIEAPSDEFPEFSDDGLKQNQVLRYLLKDLVEVKASKRSAKSKYKHMKDLIGRIDRVLSDETLEDDDDVVIPSEDIASHEPESDDTLEGYDSSNFTELD